MVDFVQISIELGRDCACVPDSGPSLKTSIEVISDMADNGLDLVYGDGWSDFG